MPHIGLERGGADFVLLCTNTMHLMADASCRRPSRSRCSISPIRPPRRSRRRDSAKSVCSARRSRWSRTSTRDGCEKVFGLEVLVPDADDRRVVHDVIYRELVAGEVRSGVARWPIARSSRGWSQRGAQAIILGCTEIMLLVSAEDSAVPLFDTTTLHAIAAVDRALASTSPARCASAEIRACPAGAAPSRFSRQIARYHRLITDS